MATDTSKYKLNRGFALKELGTLLKSLLDSMLRVKDPKKSGKRKTSEDGSHGD